MKKDKLSVIVPCYNHGKYLRECIESINNNKISIEKEVIVVDDCSTDDSFEIAENLVKDFNFILVKTLKNTKLPGVRNYGISLCSGNLIVCLDADDKIPKNYFQDNYNNMLINKIDISYSNSIMFGITNGILNWPEYDIKILQKSPFIHCASMYWLNVWNFVGGYDEKMINGWEDYDFWLNAARLGFRFKKCNSTYIYYRQGSSHFSNIHKNDNNNVKEYLRNKHFGFYLG